MTDDTSFEITIVLLKIKFYVVVVFQGTSEFS